MVHEEVRYGNGDAGNVQFFNRVVSGKDVFCGTVAASRWWGNRYHYKKRSRGGNYAKPSTHTGNRSAKGVEKHDVAFPANFRTEFGISCHVCRLRGMEE